MSNEEELGPIEESLRRSFAPPDLSALQAKIDEAARAPAPVVDELAARRRPVLLAAIVVAAAAALVLFVWRAKQDGAPQKQIAANSPRHIVGANLASFVADRQLPSVADGASCRAVRRPPENCIDDTVKPWLPANNKVEVLGECGPDGPDCESSGLVAGTGIQLRMRPAGPRFFVCMDRLPQDPRPLLPTGSSLRLFRRELGAYVIYEITPLSEPQTLNLFKL